VSGKGQHDAFTGYTPERPILVNLPPTPAASTNSNPNRLKDNFFKNYNFYRSVLVTDYMASSHDEIRNYYKGLPGRTDRFVDRGKDGGICLYTTYVTVLISNQFTHRTSGSLRNSWYRLGYWLCCMIPFL